MKILFPIGTLYPSQQGGPSNTIFWMAKALVASGITVTIVTTNTGAEDKVPADRWLNTDYGQVIYHRVRSMLLPWPMLRSTLAAIPDCDLVHLTSLFYPPSLLAALTARWYGKPIIWSPRGELDRLALIYSPWKKKPVLWLIRHLLSGKITFHSTSPEETERIKIVLGRRVRIVEVPNFLELPTIIPSEPTVNPYLLCIGRIHPKKAIENLVEALPYSLSFMKSDFTLVIAGDSNNAYGKELSEKVRTLDLTKKVQFIGQVEGEVKQKLYAHAYFTILPSNTENFGNVVVESLAQGTPVIASTGTPWAELEQEKSGLWVSNAPLTLGVAIDKALGLPLEEYQSYRVHALELAVRRFDIRKNIGVWINIYQTHSI